MTTILIKKRDTTGAPTTSDLTNLSGGAEIAVNTYDKRIYTMNSSSAVVELGINPTSLTTSQASITVFTSGSATITNLLATSAQLTALSGTNLTYTSGTITTLAGSSAAITTLSGSSAVITNIADGLGAIRNIPQSSAKTAPYTLQTSDNGTYILTSSGTITVPNNTFAAGNAVSIFNNSASSISLTLSTTTAYVAGTNTNRTGVALVTRGLATVLFVNPSACVISGNVT